MPMYNLTYVNKIIVGSQEYSKAYLGSELILGDYTILTPEMVSGTIGNHDQRYIGSATHLIIDDSFPADNLRNLFRDNQTLISLVMLTDKITDMNYMFYNVGSQLKSLSMDTSNVTNMNAIFRESKPTSLDVSSFNTSNVTNMNLMFQNSQATILDLSSFDTSNVINMSNTFQNSKATIGYARTQADADRFNATSNKPAGLNFIVKEA